MAVVVVLPVLAIDVGGRSPIEKKMQ